MNSYITADSNFCDLDFFENRDVHKVYYYYYSQVEDLIHD